MNNLGADLEKFAALTLQRTDTVTRAVLLKMGESVIQMSPVGNPDIWLSLNPYTDVKTGKAKTGRKPPAGYVGGRFRANWQFGVGALPSGTVPGVDKSGSATKNKLAAAISKINAGGVYYISNNLPYAVPLEMGWSRQAPSGMVRLTVDRFKRIVSQSVKAVK